MTSTNNLHKRIDKKLFAELSEVHAEHCVSLYINTDDPEKAQIRLKNQLSEAENTLENEYQLKGRPISGILRPIREKLDDPYFWRQGKKGLAIFSFGDEVLFILNDKKFYPVTYVADHLYLLPLAPMVSHTQSAYLLTLSAQNVRLFEASPSVVVESPISEKLPKQIGDIVGEEVVQKSLQFRTGQEGTDRAMFHGQGSGSEEEQKKEYREFFKAVDYELKDGLKDQKRPLILAGVDYLLPIYRDVSNYQHIYDKPLTGNFDDAKAHDLHKKVEPIFHRMHEQLLDQFAQRYNDFINYEKASYKAEEVVPAAINGKLETLFLREGEDLYGKYELSTNRIETDEKRAINNSSLFNMAARHTVKNNGHVFVLPNDKMPDKNSAICGIYRFSD